MVNRSHTNGTTNQTKNLGEFDTRATHLYNWRGSRGNEPYTQIRDKATNMGNYIEGTWQRIKNE